MGTLFFAFSFFNISVERWHKNDIKMYNEKRHVGNARTKKQVLSCEICTFKYSFNLNTAATIHQNKKKNIITFLVLSARRTHNASISNKRKVTAARTQRAVGSSLITAARGNEIGRRRWKRGRSEKTPQHTSIIVLSMHQKSHSKPTIKSDSQQTARKLLWIRLQ
jgi:hypothetical protein